jgi:hypothetical protein
MYVSSLAAHFQSITVANYIPGFPTRYRSTSHGISAASGKVGAILAQVLIGPLRTRGATGKVGSNASPWLNHVIEIFALFMLCGIFTTLLLPETKRKTLVSPVSGRAYPSITLTIPRNNLLERCQEHQSSTLVLRVTGHTVIAPTLTRVLRRLTLVKRVRSKYEHASVAVFMIPN